MVLAKYAQNQIVEKPMKLNLLNFNPLNVFTTAKSTHEHLPLNFPNLIDLVFTSLWMYVCLSLLLPRLMNLLCDLLTKSCCFVY